MNVPSRMTFVAVILTAATMTAQSADAQQTASGSTIVGHSTSAPEPTESETPTAPATGPLTSSGVVDVALQEDGVIRGRVLKTDGSPVDGSRVVLKKGDRVVAAVISEADGQFKIKGLTSGVYQIETPTGHGVYRFWTSDAAPPSAMRQALLVSKEPVLRSQFRVFTPGETLALALGAAGLGVGIVALNEVNDLDSKVSQQGTAINRMLVSP